MSAVESLTLGFGEEDGAQVAEHRTAPVPQRLRRRGPRRRRVLRPDRGGARLGGGPGRAQVRLVHPIGVWPDRATDETGLAWVRDLATTVRGHGETGTYLNVDDADDDRVRWAMGEARYRRLQRAKAAWDPEDVFRHCAHIRLPGAE